MNNITLSGKVTENPSFSHEIYKERFSKFYIESARTSGTKDTIQCVASEIMVAGIGSGDYIKIFGEIRTRNVYEENGERHLEILVFVREILDYGNEDENHVEINGFICKDILRKTPLGREIADLIIASNRRFGKTSYIPTIAWGRNALKASLYNIGTYVEVVGRLQSREYTKKHDDGTTETKVAYEVSASFISQ